MTSTPDPTWIPVDRLDFELLWRYPARATGNIAVVVKERTGERGTLIHMSAPEDGINHLYIEVARFAGLTPREEYDRHTPYLRERFGPEAVSSLAPGDLNGLTGWTYEFHWETGQRTVFNLAIGSDTYRIIWDPEIEANQSVLDSVERRI